MASHVEHEIEEFQPNKQGTGRGKGKKWSDSETDKLIDHWRNIFAYLFSLLRLIHALV